MDKSYLVACLAFVLSASSAQSNGNQDTCFTPSDENGICKNIQRCPPLLSLLNNQRRTEAEKTLLRNSFCGYENRDPKVCCPLENESGSNNRPGNNNLTNKTTQKPVEQPDYETVSSSKLPSQSTCGKTSITHERIVGGMPAELGAWPWMAALGFRDTNVPNKDIQWLCGGALISDRYVLTAAHCTVGLGRYKLETVHLGDLDLNPNVADDAVPINVPIARILTHEQYNAREYTTDIALLKLNQSVRFNEFIKPICLPILSKMRSRTLEGTAPFVAGWGATSFRGPSSSALMELQIPVMNNTECKRIFASKKSVIDERVLCAGVLTGGKDACQVYLLIVKLETPKLCINMIFFFLIVLFRAIPEVL
ncbi:Hypothetical protein CINCED_3A022459 [Cinara cedri]|uniref:CLIP domain-containing serine protease n=1 Tax=Cinara cedri TaxID=506608 RepID=A0A5E4N2P4_9HEMI|nr:Hypothetical protein CINCED_3A022459 [Cinara cedri]